MRDYDMENGGHRRFANLETTAISSGVDIGARLRVWIAQDTSSFPQKRQIILTTRTLEKTGKPWPSRASSYTVEYAAQWNKYRQQ
jgi:hypothetical protein